MVFPAQDGQAAPAILHECRRLAVDQEVGADEVEARVVRGSESTV